MLTKEDVCNANDLNISFVEESITKDGDFVLILHEGATSQLKWPSFYKEVDYHHADTMWDCYIEENDVIALADQEAVWDPFLETFVIVVKDE